MKVKNRIKMTFVGTRDQVFSHIKMLKSHEMCYLTGRCSCILAISPMEGSERVYMVARIAMTTKSQEEGLAG